MDTPSLDCGCAVLHVTSLYFPDLQRETTVGESLFFTLTTGTICAGCS